MEKIEKLKIPRGCKSCWQKLNKISKTKEKAVVKVLLPPKSPVEKS